MEVTNDIAAWSAVGALAAAVVLLALAVVLFARWRRAAGRELAGARSASERTEALLAGVNEALAELRRDAPPPHELPGIDATLDLDAALERALAAAAAALAGDAAMIVLKQTEDAPIVATFGLSAAESERDLVGLPPDAGPVRAVELGYVYGPQEELDDAFRLTRGLAVPLVAEDGERVGTLALFWRRREHRVSEPELTLFEDLARRFGPALENARRFRELERLAATDFVTGLPNRRYLDDRLARECARARRYDRRLALLVVVTEPADVAALTAAATSIRAAVRATDVACHVGGGRFAVVMPEAVAADAERLFRRLRFALGGRVDGDGERVSARGGWAELEPRDDAETLLARAEEALAAAADPAMEQLHAGQGP